VTYIWNFVAHRAATTCIDLTLGVTLQWTCIVFVFCALLWCVNTADTGYQCGSGMAVGALAQDWCAGMTTFGVQAPTTFVLDAGTASTVNFIARIVRGGLYLLPAFGWVVFGTPLPVSIVVAEESYRYCGMASAKVRQNRWKWTLVCRCLPVLNMRLRLPWHGLWSV
jgi:hypothetical protein